MERDKGVPVGHDSGWHEVVRRNRRSVQGGEGKVDVASSAWKVPYMETCSFYFSEFPETHRAKDMLKAFKLYGDAMEVVIPPKRDKWGRRFGFVRFRNVGDQRMFAIKLDNIIFGATKIHVNIPRFHRERNENVQPHPFQQPRVVAQRQTHRRDIHKPYHVKAVWRKKEDGIGGGRKMERHDDNNVWRKGNNLNTEAPKIVYHRKNNIAEVCYTVGEDNMQKYRKMYVGIVRTPGSTYSAHEWFSLLGIFSIKVTPLGANKVLLEEMEEGTIQLLMNEYKDLMYEKFEDVRGWNPVEVDNERVVWVRCHGIPIHAWNDDFFASLARNFGEYLGVDEATRTKTTMDIARIRLRSNGYDVFNAVVTANINGSRFPIYWLKNGVDHSNGLKIDAVKNM